MNNQILNSVIKFPVRAFPFKQPTASMYLRLNSTTAIIYYHTNENQDTFLMVSIPSAHKGMKEVPCSGDSEIVDLICRGILVPDIESDKEYIIQCAVGSVDYRTYRLQSKIAAQYQFPYEVQMTLNTIENLIMLCDYNIFDDSQVDGQKLLEIIPRDGTIVRNYQGEIISEDLPNEMYYIDQFSFDIMLSRGIIVVNNNKWKLSRKYWEFNL